MNLSDGADCTAWQVRLKLAFVVAIAAWSSGCASVTTGVNTRLVAVEEDIILALRRDDLSRARELAVELESQQPAADTYGLLGEVLWRTGELVDAEGLFRRAESGGAPRGHLGLARADLARNRREGIRERIEPLRALPELAREAHLLLAAVSWSECRCPEAAMELSAASGARFGGGVWPGVEAAALEAVEVRAGDALLAWAGATSALALDELGRVPVRVNEHLLRLTLALDGRRTTIGGAAAAMLAPDVPTPAVSALVARVQLGELGAMALVRLDPTQPADGVLGLDLLATLGWELSLARGTLRLAPAQRAGTDLAPERLQSTYFGAVRLPREGLGVQLLLRPRVGGRVITGILDVTGPSRLAELAVPAVAPGETAAGVGDRLDLELRLGSRRQLVSWTVADLLPLGAGGVVAPRVVLGTDVLSALTLRWHPDRLQVSYEEIAPAAARDPGR